MEKHRLSKADQRSKTRSSLSSFVWDLFIYFFGCSASAGEKPKHYAKSLQGLFCEMTAELKRELDTPMKFADR